jgi:predicted glycosyltransferase
VTRARDGGTPRILFVANEILGLGHMRIALRLSTAIQSRIADVSILLLTASSVTHAFPLPPGVDTVRIPGVMREKDSVTAYRPTRLPLPFEAVKRVRQRIIGETTRAYRPDLVLVDYRPAGVRGELLPALRALKRQGDVPLVLLLRDILDDPDLVRARWRADGAMSALPLYDEIWVYGCQGLYDPIRECGLPDAAARKVRFCGYLDVEPPSASTAEVRRSLGLAEERFVLATIGNGRVGFPALDAYVRGLALLPESPRTSSLVVGGPELPPAERAIIARQCEATSSRHPAHQVRFVDFTPRLLDFMGAADVVVSLGGYNTMAEILRLEKRAIVVPHVDGNREQLIRVSLLERFGLVRTILPEALSPAGLAEQVVFALGDGWPARPRLQDLGFDFGGLERIRDHVVRLLERAADGPSGEART